LMKVGKLYNSLIGKVEESVDDLEVKIQTKNDE